MSRTRYRAMVCVLPAGRLNSLAVIAIPGQIYDAPGGLPLDFDFFRPNHDDVLPLVVFTHGGGWISGDKTHFHEEAFFLCDNGFACACISYRLAPLHPFPAAVEDSQNFIRFARANAEKLMIDPNRIAAMGSSAGGHLAAMLGLCDELIGADHHPEWTKFSPKVNAVVDFSGITDLTAPREQHLPIAWSFLEQFMGAPFEDNEDLYQKASPIFHVSKTDAPFLIVHGDMDDVVPIDQSVRLQQALSAVGVSSELVVLPGEGHGFSLEVWDEVRQIYLGFLKRTLGVT